MTDARITIDPRFRVGQVNRRLFGSFVEHLGRCVYDGIFEPTHPTADADGFRQDVVELVRELGVSAIRYPGGNFVSGYRWEDGVGPREERPRRLDLAWHSIETNEVGLDEFARWADAVGSEVMLAVNLGTRGVAEAVDLLEYSNVRSGTALSDLRIANGTADPHNVRIWCLGNEMDGPWQLGHRSADDYGKLAAQTARAMRQVDNSLELVVCGSSSARMPTFGTWEREVLEHCYEEVDYISCHAYYEQYAGDRGSFLASAVDLDRFIESISATIDHVKAVTRSTRTVSISFDEWNVWYLERYEAQDKITDPEHWPTAPRLLEDAYSVVDAVVFGSLLISLINHADRVTSASLAQLVNVIAPIMTEPGGPAWRQTTFFPFATASRLAQGDALDVRVEADSYETERHGIVPVVDASATFDESSGDVALFLVNRSEKPLDVTIDLSGFDALSLAEAVSLWDDDPMATNTLQTPDRVGLLANETASIASGVLTATLPPISWTALSLGTQ